MRYNENKFNGEMQQKPTNGFSNISGSLCKAGGYIATLSPARRLCFVPSSISKLVSLVMARTINTPLVSRITSFKTLSVKQNNINVIDYACIYRYGNHMMQPLQN